MSRSERMKEANADKKNLSGVAREVYLRGIASLSNCIEVARSGNQGKGYVIR